MALATAATLALAAGCGAGQISQTANSVTATNGAEGTTGTIAVRDAQLASRPPVAGDALHQLGADVPVKLTIVNQATGRVPGVIRPDRLVSVSSPLFGSARITGDTRVTDGHALVAGYDEPVSSLTRSGAHRIGITLVGLRSPLRAGLTCPVTLTFERAGTLTLQLPVENPDFVLPRADDDPRTHR
ncbi:MAG: copper chaperone PCu(A)C [Pseudonocardia sp.]|nr:copper chaperone PCu(A)C [Pseudonocardia sp.]